MKKGVPQGSKSADLLKRSSATLVFAAFFVLVAAIPSTARKKDTVAYGEGLIVNIPLPALEVEQVVQEIAANGIIRGTKEYNKDEFVSGAQPANSSSVFPEWKQSGKVFYKVRTQALDPRNFKESGDLGTLVVRYVVQPQGPKNTVLRIDALFKEDFKHTVHPSNGSVESDEYRDIQDHLDFLELMKKEDAAATQHRQQELSRKQSATAQADPAIPAPAESSSREVAQTVESKPVPAPVPRQTVQPASTPDSPPAESLAQAPTQVAANSPVPATQPPPANVAAPTSSSSPNSGQTLEERVKNLRSQVVAVIKSPGAPLKSAPFHSAINLQTLATGAEVLIVISTPYWYGVETHDGQHGWIMRDELEQP